MSPNKSKHKNCDVICEKWRENETAGGSLQQSLPVFHT